MRQLLEVQQEVRDPQEFLQNLKIDLYPEEVYIFTPKGEVRSLARGATAVDWFASRISSGRKPPDVCQVNDAPRAERRRPRYTAKRSVRPLKTQASASEPTNGRYAVSFCS